MSIFTYSNERWELSRMLGLAEPLAALYGDRWRPVYDVSTLCGTFAHPLPSLRRYLAPLGVKDIFIFGRVGGPEGARCVAEQASSLFTGRCAIRVVWAPLDGTPRQQHWGTASARMDDRGVLVGVNLKDRMKWVPAVLLPAIIEAGALPIEYGEAEGQPTVRHRIDDRLLGTRHGERLELANWECLLPGETMGSAIARAEGIAEAMAAGPRQTFWMFDAHETTEADELARLALWERLVEIQPPASDYGVNVRLGIRDTALLERLHTLPGEWDITYWFGSVNLRDEQGNPVGFEEDDGVALFINVGVETSPAGHRLVLESNNSFNRDPITRVTGLTFTDWEE